MSGLPMMPWYPRDFLSSTRTWPFVARAIYRELLDLQWDAGSLPADQKALRLIVGCTAAQWREAWPLIERKLPVCKDSQRRNPKLESHRAESLDRHEKNRDRARKAAAASWRARRNA